MGSLGQASELFDFARRYLHLIGYGECFTKADFQKTQKGFKACGPGHIAQFKQHIGNILGQFQLLGVIFWAFAINISHRGLASSIQPIAQLSSGKAHYMRVQFEYKKPTVVSN